VRHRRAIVFVFLPFVVGFYLSYLFRSINALIADQLMTDLSLTAADLGLLTSVYFLTFAAIQLPLGIWLDRYGPRQVQSILLAVAALGAALFGSAERFPPLVLGRALLGLGFAGALVSGLKAIALWFPQERVALVNGCFLTVGALGAVTATVPAEWLLPLIGWHGLFLVLVPMTALCAIAIYFVVPESQATGSAPTAAAAIDLRAIYSDSRFWRLAPLSATCIGTSWALPSLWAASWLSDVDGLGRPAVVRHLFVMAVALCVAALAIGIAADRLRRRGVWAETLFAYTAGLFITAQFALVQRWPLPSYLLWSIVAGTGAATVLTYAILAECFPKEATGRANGALNTLHFGLAFIVQWTVGLTVQQWTGHGGHYPATAYQIALGVNLVPQVMAFVWFVCPRRLALRPMASLQVLREVYSSRLSQICAAVTAIRVRALDKALRPTARLWLAHREPPLLPPLRVLRGVCASDPPGQVVDPRMDRVHKGRHRDVHAESIGWPVAAVGCALLCALLSLLLGVVASRARTTVHPNKETVISSGVANPFDLQIIYFLGRFIENARSLSTDPIVVRASWHNAYAYVTGHGLEVLTEYGRELAPFTMVGMRTVSVEIISTERISSDSFLIRWRERSFENGLRMNPEHFTGVFAVVFCRPASPQAMITNPLGIYIHAIDWSRKVGQSGRHRLDPSAGSKRHQPCA
jgi:type IV secretory pathway TrbF-like protein/nitrate/nitrite transporter NarK